MPQHQFHEGGEDEIPIDDEDGQYTSRQGQNDSNHNLRINEETESE